MWNDFLGADTVDKPRTRCLVGRSAKGIIRKRTVTVGQGVLNVLKTEGTAV